MWRKHKNYVFGSMPIVTLIGTNIYQICIVIQFLLRKPNALNPSLLSFKVLAPRFQVEIFVKCVLGLILNNSIC